jgi:hypothetical protein
MNNEQTICELEADDFESVSMIDTPEETLEDLISRGAEEEYLMEYDSFSEVLIS